MMGLFILYKLMKATKLGFSPQRASLEYSCLQQSVNQVILLLWQQQGLLEVVFSSSFLIPLFLLRGLPGAAVQISESNDQCSNPGYLPVV